MNLHSLSKSNTKSIVYKFLALFRYGRIGDSVLFASSSSDAVIGCQSCWARCKWYRMTTCPHCRHSDLHPSPILPPTPWGWLNVVIATNNLSALTLLVGWQVGHLACKRTEWWGAGMVICLEPLLLIVSCFSKIHIGLPFWYQLTRGVPEKGPLNVCVCVITKYNSKSTKLNASDAEWPHVHSAVVLSLVHR